MPINLTKTNTLKSRGKIITVYGEAKSGKTRLGATLPNLLAIGLEPGGLASMSSFDVDCVECTTLPELNQVMQFLSGDSGAKYDNVMIDSASQLAEMQLAAAMKVTKDGRQAYGIMKDKFLEMLSGFRAAFPDKNLYMPAKLSQVQNETNQMLYSPNMPGNAVSLALPHVVDCIFALRGTGTDYKLQTQSDDYYRAGTRIGVLDQWMAPDLGAIVERISA